MKTVFEKTTLPDGEEIFCHNNREALLVYDQVQLYFNHNIQLKTDDTVFDVGANIGMFTLKANQLGNNNINIYAFEPIPQTYKLLNANIQQLNSTRVHAFNCGLSSTLGTAKFTYYPNHTTLSTQYSDAENEEDVRNLLKQSTLDNLDDVLDKTREPSLVLHVIRWLPRFLRKFIINWMSKKSFHDAENIECELKTVSEIIRNFNINEINLLKIDVEKGELSVLEGISAEDWPKIKQVVMEIHDLDNRLQVIENLLRRQGMNKIIIEQEPGLKNSNVYSLYALR